MLFGLWKRRSVAPETRSALAWLQHGKFEAAQDALTNALDKNGHRGYENGEAAVNPKCKP